MNILTKSLIGAGMVGGIAFMSSGDPISQVNTVPIEVTSTPAVPTPKVPQKTTSFKEVVPVANTVEPKETEPECHTGYSGCLNPNASDYDCRGGSGNGPYYTGKVRVLGYDEFDLDRDNDGWGCE